MWISKKKLDKLICEAYGKGVNNGYVLARWLETTKTLRDLEDMLGKARGDNA